MGKPKQQVISRFFSPKPPPNPNPNNPNPSFSSSSSSPKIITTVSFSPAKRSLAISLTPPAKKAKTLAPSSNPNLHQKFISKLLEPPSPPSSSSPPLSNPNPNPNYTPLEKQVLHLKSAHSDVILMVEVGYRYRFFGEDAEVAAKTLGIYAHMDHNFLTASIPTFRLNFHVRRLVSAGYKVGVVKQTETAAIKAHGGNKVGPFTRGLDKLYTKATIEAVGDSGEEGGGGEGNYLVCVVERGGEEEGVEVRVGVVGVEVSTGEVVFGEFNDGAMRSGVEGVVLGLGPAEILMGEPLSMATEKLLLAYAGPSSNVRVERTSCDCFNDGGALAEVLSLFEKVNEDTLNVEHDTQEVGVRGEDDHRLGIEGIMSMPELACQALALAIRYLKEFGLERIICSGMSFHPFSGKVEMTLSANTLRQLEVLKNNSNGCSEGSLLQAMNHTCTAFGSRLHKHWIAHPLRDRNSISARLDAVAEIAESMGSCSHSQKIIVQEEGNTCNSFMQPEISNVLSSILTTLARSADIQRGITRIFHRTATASEFIGVIHVILLCGKQLQKLHVENNEISEGSIVKSTLLRRLILTASSSTIIARAAKLLSSLDRDAANQGDMLNLFIASAEQFPEVAKGRIDVEMAREKLDLLIVQYRKQLRMSKLEFISVSGTTHLIELPTDTRVPSNWVKVNSTKKTNRYHPPEVLTALDKLTLAKEELAITCKTTWDTFLLGFGKYYAQFQAVVQAIAALDCLHSLAVLSRNQNYIRPVFVNDDEPSQINIQSGRHPVLDSVLGDTFVPNDTNLHADVECCQIVTGPNMGGKSCYIRQVALISIMAQVGSFVPASSAKLHVLDGIFTRMGASDSIQQGTSTFFEELSEASDILQNCTPHSLVIIDELGRGTSTHDGVAIAYSTLHYLLERKKCMVLFVTHYPKILDIQKEFKGCIGAYHVSYLTSEKQLDITENESEVSRNIDQAEVTFLYKVVAGASDKSFGFNVARLAELPSSCITRAAVMAAKLEADVNARTLNQKSNPETSVQPEALRISSIRSSSTLIENEQFEELTRALHKIFSHVRNAFKDDDPVNVLSSLKAARELALTRLKSSLFTVKIQNISWQVIHDLSCSKEFFRS